MQFAYVTLFLCLMQVILHKHQNLVGISRDQNYIDLFVVQTKS